MGLSSSGSVRQLSVVSMSMIMVIVIVAMIVVVTIATVVIVRVAVAIAVIAVVLVLAVMVSVIVPDLIVILISVPLMFPATVSAPVGTLAATGKRAAVSEMRIIVVVDVAMETNGTAEPRPGTEKHPRMEPFRTVVAERRALIGRIVEVSVGAYRRHPDRDIDLRGRSRIGAC
jgi:hypothetical protein